MPSRPTTTPSRPTGRSTSATRRCSSRRAVRGSSSAEHGRALWKPAGRPRLGLVLEGRYADGWLASAGRITVWPDSTGAAVAGRLRIELSAPDAVREMTFSFRSPGRRALEAVVPGGETRVVTL